eukprot:g10149.t1
MAGAKALASVIAMIRTEVPHRAKSARLGLGPGFPVPVEIVPFCHEHTMRQIAALPALAGCEPVLRLGNVANNQKDGDEPAITDNGNYIATVGVVDHGLFTGMTTACIVAGSDGIIVKAPRVREDRREPAVMVHTIWEPNPRALLARFSYSASNRFERSRRKEIVRILGHLPLIREFRDHPGERPERGERGEPLTARPRSSYSTRPQSSRPARPQSSGGRAQKGHTPTAAPHSARYVPRPPMSARKQAWDAPKSARRPESRPEESKQQIRRPATPREAAQEGRLRSPCPVAFFENQQEVEEPKLQAHEEKPPVQEEAWYQQAMKTAAASARLGFAAMPLEDEVPVRRDSEEAAARTRYLRKLAEVGIDPEGMTAGDILRSHGARDSSTTYRRMNKEAQKKLLVRVKTPLCMRTVLKERAVQEVVAARDKPAEQVHECLDRWEIDTLAEVCRSLKYFDEETETSDQRPGNRCQRTSEVMVAGSTWSLTSEKLILSLLCQAMVTDNDPRAQGSSSSSATQRRRKKRPQQAPSSSAPAGTEENVIVGDLARMVGVHGKTQEIMGHSVPLIYLIVGAIALLWISGNTNAIHMIVLGFLIYMYSQYTRAQSGGSGGSPPDDNSSRGHAAELGVGSWHPLSVLTLV